MRDFLHAIPVNRLGPPAEMVGPVAFLALDEGSSSTRPKWQEEG